MENEQKKVAMTCNLRLPQGDGIFGCRLEEDTYCLPSTIVTWSQSVGMKDCLAEYIEMTFTGNGNKLSICF